MLHLQTTNDLETAIENATLNEEAEGTFVCMRHTLYYMRVLNTICVYLYKNNSFLPQNNLLKFLPKLQMAHLQTTMIQKLVLWMHLLNRTVSSSGEENSDNDESEEEESGGEEPYGSDHGHQGLQSI